jgi:hypothetical protein
MTQAILRTARSSSRAINTISNAPIRANGARNLSSSSQLRAASAHEDHYDPPSGWLFGIKPGEKYQKEGWEGLWIWGFFGSLAVATVAYAFKPDTS